MPVFIAALFPLLPFAPPARGDLATRPLSSDLDAEFARAADLLETEKRDEGIATLNEMRARPAGPAWSARIALLLAQDALGRSDAASAIRELETAASSAGAIGLEPYRHVLLARAFGRAGRPGDALAEWRAAWESEETFAWKPNAGRSLADELLRGGPASAKEAEAVLKRVVEIAPRFDPAGTAAARIRAALAAADHGGALAAARDLLMTGLDPAAAPVAARPLLKEALARLTPADRGELGRRLAEIGGAAAVRGTRLLRQDPPASWPVADRSSNRLALARALLASSTPVDRRAGQAALAGIPEDGTPADFSARLVRADLALEEIRRRRSGPLTTGDPVLAAARRPYLALSVPPAPLSVRSEARERLVRLAAEAEEFDDGLEHARALVAASPGTVAGFEPLWRLAWARYRARDFTGARQRFEALAGLYRDTSRERRLLYWRARCVDQEGRSAEAIPLFESLAAASPADVYALFARRRVSGYRPRNEPALVDPSTETAAFRRTEELLRVRLFEEGAAEARALPPSKGRDLRLAEAEFALGRFAPAAAAVKRAFPEIATAEEARVPDAWRRLYYPIEVGGYLARNAAEAQLDPAILRGLVRQESVFDSGARSRAGALGLTQLMPATARGLAKSVLRVRYRRAFLYDPTVNSKLGAAYLKSLFDRFSGNPLWALAAYNGGPTRMARVLRENAGLPEDEVFESHPAYETRDYVRRVMLFAESYRELYPGKQVEARLGTSESKGLKGSAAP